MGKDALRIEKFIFHNDQLVRVENINFIAITSTYGQGSLVCAGFVSATGLCAEHHSVMPSHRVSCKM